MFHQVLVRKYKENSIHFCCGSIKSLSSNIDPLPRDIAVLMGSFCMDAVSKVLYNLNVMQKSACLVINPRMADSFAALFNCRPVDLASDFNGPELFILVGWDRSFRLLLGQPRLN